MLLDRSIVGRRKRVVDGFLEDRAAAEALVDHCRRNLALAETGDVDLAGNVLVGLVKMGLELVEGDLNGELHTRVGELLYSAGHELTP